jgi:hypothetical protein
MAAAARLAFLRVTISGTLMTVAEVALAMPQ